MARGVGCEVPSATVLLALVLAAAIDGEAARAHAARLSSLGPHPFGSPRARIAAEYVAEQFRQAGLDEVRIEGFESQGTRGGNVLGVLRAPGREFVVVSAHHDTAPDSAGTYEAGAVGVLIEAARTLSRRSPRPRTLVFASWDGAEAGPAPAAGSAAYVRSLGSETRQLVAALAVGRCGAAGARPVLHSIAYPDPMRSGASVIAPAWLMRAALAGAAGEGEPIGVGDPLLSWIYQPAVRCFRVRVHGDDLSFLQARLPAACVSDRAFTTSRPERERLDTPDRLDGRTLERMGRAVVGIVATWQVTPRGPDSEPTWFSAFGHVLGPGMVFAAGAVFLALGLAGGLRRGGLVLAARVVQAGCFATLLWRHPVPATWVFALPCVVALAAPRRWSTILALTPTLALLAWGGAGWWRGVASGLWPRPWELVLTGMALGLLWVRPPARGAGRQKGIKGARR